LEHFELLLDCSRKTCSCIYEHVQSCAGECRHSQAEENDRPKHRAIISDRVGRRQVPGGFAEAVAILWTPQEAIARQGHLPGRMNGAGHIGLAVSGRAQKELWPRAVDWLVQRTD